MSRRSEERYQAYRAKADPIVAVLALILLILVSVALSSVTGDLSKAGTIATALLWAALVVDIVVRLTIVPSIKHYVLHHPFEVLSVLVPFMRVILVGRLFGILGRGRRRLADRATGYVGFVTVLALVFGSLLAVDFEKDAPGATITSFGEGMWWAIVTVATVGYGDVVPVTAGGKWVGVGLILVSIGLLSIITANISSRFVLARTAGEAESEENRLLEEKLDRIEATLERLEARLAERE